MGMPTASGNSIGENNQIHCLCLLASRWLMGAQTKPTKADAGASPSGTGADAPIRVVRWRSAAWEASGGTDRVFALPSGVG
ncbi:hypothetical protein GCM10010442_33860 [Kitasatospora kifunensis]|uniref:Uncharacterized protein n=1 Tax=Kitasatospora kifunensis TaxID=58351 RepID=A0A7W7RA15_KITKI|nr:hypothetical protein [Kitasatospora kifunensis]